MLFGSAQQEEQFKENHFFGLHDTCGGGYTSPAGWAEDAAWHCVGEYAAIEYENGKRVGLLLPYASYSNPRNYVESAWARDAILRVRTSMTGDSAAHFDTSIPTKGISDIQWFFAYATDENFAGPQYQKDPPAPQRVQ